MPKKSVEYVLIDMTEEELAIYDMMEKRSQEVVEGYLANGILMSKYMKMFELLLRLRQICDHPFLMTTRSDVRNIDQLEEAINTFLVSRKGRRNEEHEEILFDGNEEIKIKVSDNH